MQVIENTPIGEIEMNGRLAKAIRRAVGFHPAADRRYAVPPLVRGYFGRWITGTVKSTRARSHYQNFKAGVLSRKRAAA